MYPNKQKSIFIQFSNLFSGICELVHVTIVSLKEKRLTSRSGPGCDRFLEFLKSSLTCLKLSSTFFLRSVSFSKRRFQHSSLCEITSRQCCSVVRTPAVVARNVIASPYNKPEVLVRKIKINLYTVCGDDKIFFFSTTCFVDLFYQLRFVN